MRSWHTHAVHVDCDSEDRNDSIGHFNGLKPGVPAVLQPDRSLKTYWVKNMWHTLRHVAFTPVGYIIGIFIFGVSAAHAQTLALSLMK